MPVGNINAIFGQDGLIPRTHRETTTYSLPNSYGFTFRTLGGKANRENAVYQTIKQSGWVS